MRGTYEATASIEVAADVAAVWRALTDPQIVKQYFFGTEVESDWKKGGKIYFRGSWEGKSYEDKGTILEIDPPRLLKFSSWSSLSGTEDLPENYANVAYHLTTANGRTRLTIRQDNVATEEAKDHSAANWKMVLEGLKAVVEGGAVTE
ncbi:MAG TPA: SRPBCC family protein [Spirochaetia bacterium]|nr:SRPBCC family protein [Spirochaetia bacterium]